MNRFFSYSVKVTSVIFDARLQHGENPNGATSWLHGLVEKKGIGEYIRDLKYFVILRVSCLF